MPYGSCGYEIQRWKPVELTFAPSLPGGDAVSTLFSLEGKVAIVTGASKEMGEAIALLLAEYGADVAVTARDEAALARLAERIRAMGRRSIAIPADLTVADGRTAIVERT